MIYYIKVPVTASLGVDEKDFSNVEIQVFTCAGEAMEMTEDHVATIFAEGVLGGLKGGLLDLDFARARLQAEEVGNLAKQNAADVLDRKRTLC